MEVSEPTEEAPTTPVATPVDAYGRMKGVSLVKPIVYGSSATYFPKKREEDGHTHSWSIYLRPYYNEVSKITPLNSILLSLLDSISISYWTYLTNQRAIVHQLFDWSKLSIYQMLIGVIWLLNINSKDTTKWIRKVTFKLHESYANSTRTCDKPPYFVKETGWGEFEIIIKIYFVDPNEKPVSCYHILKLFQQDPLCIAGKKPVLSEYYDEIVFQEPSQYLYKHLMAAEKPQKQLMKGNDPESMEEKKKRTLEKILAARDEVRTEINDFRDSLKEARTLLDSWRALNSDVSGAEPDALSSPTPAAAMVVP